jgi:feruloyl esterase
VDAPSTSPGIGIEIWLPALAHWSGRIHALGGGGWVGGSAGSSSKIGSLDAAKVAGIEGAISSTTDTGHSGLPRNGAFGLKPDGSINTALWRDFATRSLHEQALKTKLLANYYYGKSPRYAYWEGGSQGGRQGLSLAQNFAADYDGIIANFPAINQITVPALYPQIVFQKDLGGTPLSMDQQDLVSRAAIGSCDRVGGEALGYIMDPAACR